MAGNLSLPWDTGYALFIIAGFGIWIGVPVINSVFDLTLMTSTTEIPSVGTYQINVAIGGGMASIGILGYIGHRTGLW